MSAGERDRGGVRVRGNHAGEGEELSHRLLCVSNSSEIQQDLIQPTCRKEQLEAPFSLVSVHLLIWLHRSKIPLVSSLSHDASGENPSAAAALSAGLKQFAHLQ